jgi:hypothetical protein
MYKRNRIKREWLDVPRRRRTDKFLCSCLVCRAIKVAWIIGVLGALTLAINVVKEGM